VACRLVCKSKPHLQAFNLYKKEFSILIRSRFVSIFGNQSAGTIKKNSKLQNAVTLKLIDMGRKNIHATYLSLSICLQNLIVSSWVMSAAALM
jgi:hypothetical protein